MQLNLPPAEAFQEISEADLRSFLVGGDASPLLFDTPPRPAVPATTMPSPLPAAPSREQPSGPPRIEPIRPPEPIPRQTTSTDDE